MLSLVRAVIPFDSMFAEYLHAIIFYGSLPILWIIEKSLASCGISGDRSMLYIVPIFIIIILYWAALGFVIGAIIGSIKKQDEMHNKMLGTV